MSESMCRVRSLALAALIACVATPLPALPPWSGRAGWRMAERAAARQAVAATHAGGVVEFAPVVPVPLPPVPMMPWLMPPAGLPVVVPFPPFAVAWSGPPVFLPAPVVVPPRTAHEPAATPPTAAPAGEPSVSPTPPPAASSSAAAAPAGAATRPSESNPRAAGGVAADGTRSVLKQTEQAAVPPADPVVTHPPIEILPTPQPK